MNGDSTKGSFFVSKCNYVEKRNDINNRDNYLYFHDFMDENVLLSALRKVSWHTDVSEAGKLLK